MELWATGFNPWNQLQFDGDLPAEPRDLNQFKCILKDERIEILTTSISATLAMAEDLGSLVPTPMIRTSSGLRLAGSPDQFILLCSEQVDVALNTAIAGNDQVVEPLSNSVIEELADFTSKAVTQYESLQQYLENDGHNLNLLEEIKQIVANQTGFTAVLSTGEVYTWGDGRFESCLGREVTDECPSSKPCEVKELSSLPDVVDKISSGGFASAALTAGKDVYFWGHPGQLELLEPLTGSPTPLDLQGQDILDIAVGTNHMIVLTTKRKLFVVGDGGNGQLGSTVEQLKDWKEVSLPLEQGQRIASVHAGYKNSFVLVESST